MVNRLKKQKVFGLCIFALSIMISVTNAQDALLQHSLIPGNTNGLYYAIGGGDITPLPLASNRSEIDLNVNGNVGLGYNCGVFDPEASIVNSLNNVGASFEHMMTQVINNAEGALMELPAYKLAQAMPDLYRLIQDGIGHGQFDFTVSTKSCQQMASEIGSGKNPYNDWLQASLGDNWKYHMLLSGSQPVKSGLLGRTPQDINQAKYQINKDNGRKGVPWVQGAHKNGQLYAGGKAEPIIHLTYDTVVAGYNVLVGGQRAYSDPSAPNKQADNTWLINTFSTPKIAGTWVANVVGEHTITTFSRGKKKTTPGIGLLNEVKTQSSEIKKKLTDLVLGHQPISLARLKAVSPPRVMLNSAVIQLLRHQNNALMQAIYLNKIAQEVAVARVIDKAKLGLQLLEVGRQVPSIDVNAAAQKGIQASEERMRQWIRDLRNNPKDNEEFVGRTIVTLMGASHAQMLASAAIRPSENTPPQLRNGAIKTEQ